MKHLEQSQELRLNEILFEHRNKAYGAYVLRTESDRILTKALFMGIGLLAAVSIIPAAISAFNKAEIVTGGGYELPPPIDVDVFPDTPPVKIEPVKPVTPPERVKQYNAALATPTRNADESQIVKEIPKDAIAGIKNDFDAKPATPDVHVPISSEAGPGKIAPPRIAPPAVDPGPDNSIKGSGELSVGASFEGGIDAFRNKVMNKFDVSAFEEQGVVSTVVTFIVEKDGTISDIKTNGKDASFNAEAIRTIKAVKGKWIPGKNKKGESVRSYFKFPISMKFEN